MRKIISIPNQRRYQPILKKKNKPQINIERVRLGDIEWINRDWMSRRINLAFLLIDIIEGIIIEIESYLKKNDPYISLDIRNSIDRIKIHTRNLVSFVDKETNEEFSEQFGNRSDEIKDYLFEKFGIEN